MLQSDRNLIIRSWMLESKWQSWITMKIFGETKLLLTRLIKAHKKLAQRNGKFHAPSKLKHRMPSEDKTFNFVHSLLVSSAAVKIACPLKKPRTSTRPAKIPKNNALLSMPAREELKKSLSNRSRSKWSQ